MTTDSNDRCLDGTTSHQRDVSPAEMATLLRAMLGLDPYKQLPEERAADLRRPFPPTIYGLMTGAWIAWCLIGLTLFSGPKFPTVRAVVAAAKRAVVSLAMLRTGGNISHSAIMVGTSRRLFREVLRSSELYPWRRGTDDVNGPPSEPIRVEGPNVEPVVRLEVKNASENAGPAWLCRGRDREPLFGGSWTDTTTARAYARSHGLRFEVDGGE